MKKVCKTFMRRFDPGPRLQILQQLKLPQHVIYANSCYQKQLKGQTW